MKQIGKTFRKKYAGKPGAVEARWDAGDPPSDQALMDKFRWLAREVLPGGLVDEVAKVIWQCAELSDAADLLESIVSPLD